MITVLLVDDQEIVRNGLARILGPDDDFEVVGECADGDEVASAVRQQRPDIVVMDLRMRRVDGITATRRLRETEDPPPVLVLTTFDEDDLLWGALGAGAAGFVLKDTPAAGLIAATRAVASGGAWFDPAVTARVLAAHRRAKPTPTRRGGAFENLTAREREVLRLMCRGRSNAEIATELHLAETTVKTHVGSVFLKLEVRDRAAAIVYAFDHGLVAPGQ